MRNGKSRCAMRDDGERPGPSSQARFTVRTARNRTVAAPKRRRNTPVLTPISPKRRRGRPTKRRGQPRPNAGRKVKHGAEMHERTVRKKAKVVREAVTGDGDFLVLRKAFLQLVEDRMGSDVKVCVERLTDAGEDPVEPGVVADIRSLLENEAHLPEPLSNEECVATLVCLDLTKHQYIRISKTVNEAAKTKVMKSYNTVSKYKKECMPASGMQATEVKADCTIQALIDHTVRRTVVAYNDEIEAKLGRPCRRATAATFVLTWGFDSASGQRLYKNSFNNEASANRNNNSLFAAAINPITLKTSSGETLWLNDNPQSASVVRPVVLEFEKELPDYVRGVRDAIVAGFESLRPVIVETKAGHKISVKVDPLLTLIDGKGFNIITNTHSQECPCCRSGKAAINDLTNIGKEAFRAKGRGLCHGVQPMHAWIKILESLLKAACNKPVWDSQQRGDVFDAAELRAQVKRRIQEEYKKDGLKIDEPAQFGSGNTLDGNTSRRLFRDYKRLARVLDISEDLVKRFYVILCVINSTRYLPKIRDFRRYCIKTLRMYRQEFPFMNITPSLHKICVHSADVAEHLGFPLGLLSEGGAEAAHRIRKNARLNHTRKCGRTEEMWDLLVWDMIRSDPVIAKRSAKISGIYRKTELAAYTDLPSTAKRLLCIPPELSLPLEVDQNGESRGNIPRSVDDHYRSGVGNPVNAIDTTHNQMTNAEDASDGEEYHATTTDTGSTTYDSDTQSDTEDFGPQGGAPRLDVGELLGPDSDVEDSGEIDDLA